MKGKAKRERTGGCLPAGLLERYALGGLSGSDVDRVLDHLADCPICSRRFKILTSYFTGPPESYSGEDPGLSDEVPAGLPGPAKKTNRISPSVPGRKPAPAAGQIWLARPREGSPPALAVLLPAGGGRPAVRGSYPAAVLSWETEAAGDQDLLVGEAQSTLGLDFIVETWNRVRLPAARMEWCLGRLKPEAEGALRNMLSGRGPGEGFETGPEIESLDDARVFFQLQELKRAREAGEPEVPASPGRRPAAGRRRTKREKVKFAAVAGLGMAHAISPGIFKKHKRKTGPEDFYSKYIKPFLPLAGALAVPLIAHFFFRKLARSLEKEKPVRARGPEPSLLLGLSYCGLEKWEQALKSFAAVMGHPAARFAGLVFSAWVLARTGKFQQAEKNIRQARELPEKAKSLEIDFDRIERFIEEEREAEFREWFDRTIASCVLEDPARLLSSR